MSTDIRPELSTNNKYWTDRHRYYELKHFCLQYPIWKKARANFDGMNTWYLRSTSKGNEISDPTERDAFARLFYTQRIELIERVTRMTSPDLHEYLLKAVTEGVSYNYLKTRMGMPCGRDAYYLLYRKFFWLLSRERS